MEATLQIPDAIVPDLTEGGGNHSCGARESTAPDFEIVSCCRALLRSPTPESRVRTSSTPPRRP